MLRPKIAVLRPFPQPAMEALGEVGEVLSPQTTAPARGESAFALLRHADAALVSPLDEVTDAMLSAAPRLRAISCAGAGLDRIDLATCAELGVRVMSAADATTEPTADLAFALLLAAARRLPAADRFVRQGHWRAGAAPFWGQDVHHRTLGIVGFGRIGQAIARRAEGFSMRVIYHNRRPIPGEAAGQAQWRPLANLLAEADFVVVQTPLTGETRGLIDAQALAAMKSTAILINTGRGGVVDEAALAEALQTGEIAGAALDVFESEPDLNARLLSCPNLILAPHIGTATQVSRREMVMLAIRNLRSLLESRAGGAASPALPP